MQMAPLLLAHCIEILAGSHTFTQIAAGLFLQGVFLRPRPRNRLQRRIKLHCPGACYSEDDHLVSND